MPQDIGEGPWQWDSMIWSMSYLRLGKCGHRGQRSEPATLNVFSVTSIHVQEPFTECLFGERPRVRCQIFDENTLLHHLLTS